VPLRHVADVALPPHRGAGGFDHAAVHAGLHRIYVAHTANDAVDVIDGARRAYLHSVPGLPAVAGALVAEADDLVFTSNRGDDTIGIFPAAGEEPAARVPVGHRPNGLAYDPGRRLLLVANVGDPARPGSFTLSVVDTRALKMVAEVPVAGRTRWAVFDAATDAFYVNIADPAEIVVLEAGRPERVARTFSVPAPGPHGLDLAPGERLFCACDGRALVVLDRRSGRVLGSAELGGAPDVIFVNARRRRVYVAIGDPGVIEVFDTDAVRRVQEVPTERGAHTLAFDAARDLVYAFLPESHRAAVYRDEDA
jgi:DNA-binding beta-propeller fold protein YncE